MQVFCILNNRPSSLFSVVASGAHNGHTAQTKTAPEGAAFDYLLISYNFLRLATPIKPISPEPNSQTAVGTGTDEIRTKCEPIYGDA